MNRKDPAWWAARHLSQVLARARTSASSQLHQQIRSLIEQQHEIQRCWRRVTLAHSHGWHLAAALQERQLIDLLPSVQCQISAISQEIQKRQRPSPLPSFRDLLAEIEQLGQEFEEVIFEPKRSVVAVQTPFVTLKGIELGRFRIELYLDRLVHRPDSTALDIVALDPNCPTCNDQVTHPHVSDLGLCPGDAAAPLRAALTEGRLCDVFLLVQGVLNTYNPASAYVALEDWDGISCAECGSSCGRDELYYCPACHADFCESCIGVCDECLDSYCGSCLEQETATRRNLCPNCRATCPQCDRIGLASEIEDGGLCQQCKQEQENKHEEQSEPNPQAHAA